MPGQSDSEVGLRGLSQLRVTAASAFECAACFLSLTDCTPAVKAAQWQTATQKQKRLPENQKASICRTGARCGGLIPTYWTTVDSWFEASVFAGA